jgi:predicted GNAT family N-acyltransferase
VAIQPIQIGGRLLQCGIIDSVSTHPDHRRQGLARKLMDMAHERMQAAGADAAVLYTNPEDHPYRFYGRLGYQTRATCMMMSAVRPAERTLDIREMTAAEQSTLAAIIDGFYSDHEGYAPLSDDLWEWHKVTRPPGMEAHVMVGEMGDEIAATCTWSTIELLLRGEPKKVAAMVDFACIGDVCPGPRALESIMASAPQPDIVLLVDAADPLADLYHKAGFEKIVSEVSMVLPFTGSAHTAVGSDHGPWYVMAESVIGV